MSLLEDLKEQIAGGHAIVIVGAGVSIEASFNHSSASWRGLLHHGAARWLRESVGAMNVKHREVLDALRDLNTPLATTNYDGLIEDATGLKPVTWRDSANVERVLRGDDRRVLHLHGHWEDPESVVLGIRSYEKALGDEHSQTVLRTLAMMKTLVFIGCDAGLRDPNFGRFLEWTARVFAGKEYRRYRLALDGEREKLQAEHPPEHRLYVLSFGTGHGDLAQFLRQLAPAHRHVVKTHAALPGKPRCFGREVELAGIVSNLLADRPEPAPILGPPGIGKSTLVITALYDERVASRYGERRWFVRCDAITSRLALASGIAQALGLEPSPTIEDAVVSELGRAPSVLALDNAETPWEADPLEVEQLFSRLASVSGLALVITIRGSERPAGASWMEACRPQPLNAEAARRVFLSIAGREHAADPKLDLLLEAVDRVPLAVILMAHAAEGEPNLDGLWQRWQDERTNMLRRLGGTDQLSNLELSYEISLTGERMTADARRLLSVLALLPGGVDAKDLPALMPDGGTAASVLRKTGLAFDEHGRLRILAPLREYVRRIHQPDSADADRAADRARSEGSVLGEANCIKKLGDIALVRSDHAEACKRYEEALPLCRQAGSVLGEANCILSLGEIALARSDREAAGKPYEEALNPYQQIAEPYSIGGTFQRLARLAPDSPTRTSHVLAARAAWISIDRPDVVKKLDNEFGPISDAATTGT